jgi:hypothetical protein
MRRCVMAKANRRCDGIGVIDELSSFAPLGLRFFFQRGSRVELLLDRREHSLPPNTAHLNCLDPDQGYQIG